MNKDNHLIFEAFINKKGEVGVSRPASEEKNEHKVVCEYAEKGCDCNGCEACKANQKEENAEDKPSFHYDPMTHLADAAHQIHNILKSNADDEARTEHIEKMAEIILGPQSEYASVNQYRRVLSGVIELLHHHVSVEMN